MKILSWSGGKNCKKFKKKKKSSTSFTSPFVTSPERYYDMNVKILFLALFLFASPLQGEIPCEVMFTRPGTATCPVAARLCSCIDTAAFSIDGALYDLNSSRIMESFKRAALRGVRVRLVMESDNFYRRRLYPLLESGVQIVHDRRRGLMHNKFIVFDSKKVWTGSFNLTENGSRKNNNNAFVFSMPALARIFLNEFEEMFSEGIFQNRMNQAPLPWLRRNDPLRRGKESVEVYFSPEDGVEEILIRRITATKRSLRFLSFSFTSDRIGEAIIRKKKEGISVKGLVEYDGSNSAWSEYVKFILEGIDVRRDGRETLLHHKVIIIDDSIVIAGSYNFSKGAALRNDENIVIVKSRKVAAAFLEEFRRLYQRAKPFKRKKGVHR